MPERQLVHQSERRTTQDRNLAAGLQPAASAQFAELPIARRVCTDTSGDERMRKTSTWLLEQGTQTPSPAPDLIPAETRTENSHWDWYSERGHFTEMLAGFQDAPINVIFVTSSACVSLPIEKHNPES